MASELMAALIRRKQEREGQGVVAQGAPTAEVETSDIMQTLIQRKQEREQAQQEAPPEEETGFFEGIGESVSAGGRAVRDLMYTPVKEAITGEKLLTPETEDIGEFATARGVTSGDFGNDLKIAASNVFTTNPKARKDIIRKNLPGTTFEEMGGGYTMVVLPDGQKKWLNKPGFTWQDSFSLVGDMAAFYGPTKIAGLVKGAGKRAAVGAGTAAAVDVGMQAAEREAGSEQKYDPARTAIVAGTQAGGELLESGIKGIVKGKEAKRYAVEGEALKEAKREVAQSGRVSKKTGIDFFRAQQTENLTDLERQAFVAQLPGGSKKGLKAIEKQDKQAYNAVVDVMASIAPETAIETGEAGVRTASKVAIKKAKDARAKITKPKYDEAFQNKNIIETPETMNLIDQKIDEIGGAEGKGQIERELVKVKSYLTPKAEKLPANGIKGKQIDEGFKGSVAKEKVYHGSGTKIEEFDPSFTGQGSDQYGSGFYFTTDPKEAKAYTSKLLPDNTPKLGGTDDPSVTEAYLNIKKPIVIKGANLRDADFDITRKQALQIIKDSPNLKGEQSALNDWFDISQGITDKKLLEVAEEYTGPSMMSLENDFYKNDATAFRKSMNNVFGYDGVVHEFEDGKKHYVAWFPEQIKKIKTKKQPGLTTRQLHGKRREINNTINNVTGEFGNDVKRELTEIRTALTEEIRKKNPVYDEARILHKDNSGLVNELEESIIGQISKFDDTQLENITGKIFKTRTNPGTLRQIRAVIEKENPQAWRDIVRTEIEGRVGDLSAFSDMKGNVPAKLHTALGFKNPKKRKVLYAALNKEQARNMRYLEEGLRRASGGRPGGSQTGIRKVIEAGIRGGIGVGNAIETFFSPVKTVSGIGKETRFNRRTKALADVLFNPKWAPQRKKLRKYSPDQKKAGEDLARMLKQSLQGITKEGEE